MNNKQRLIELVQYCKSVAQLNVNIISNYNSHSIFSLNEDSFIDLKDYIKFDVVNFINNNQPLIIPKLSSDKPPEIDQPDLEVWIEKSNSVNKLPKLLPFTNNINSVTNVNYSEVLLEGVENKEVIESLFEKYMTQWTIWAEKEKKIKKVQKLYNDLYNLQQQLDNIELLCGYGIIFWNLNNVKVIYPIITKPLNLLLDQITGNIIIEPHQAKSFQLELEVFKEHNLANISILESKFNTLSSNNDKTELDNVDDFLKIASNLLDSTGELVEKNLNLNLHKLGSFAF